MGPQIVAYVLRVLPWQALSLSVSHTYTYMHTALLWVGEGDIFNSRVYYLLFFSWKKMKSSIYSGPITSTRKHRRNRNRDHKYTLGERGMEETVIDWPCKICCWIDSNFWKCQTFILCGLNSGDNNKHTYEVGLLTLFPWAPYNKTHTYWIW